MDDKYDPNETAAMKAAKAAIGSFAMTEASAISAIEKDLLGVKAYVDPDALLKAEAMRALGTGTGLDFSKATGSSLAINSAEMAYKAISGSLVGVDPELMRLNAEKSAFTSAIEQAINPSIKAAIFDRQTAREFAESVIPSSLREVHDLIEKERKLAGDRTEIFEIDNSGLEHVMWQQNEMRFREREISNRGAEMLDLQLRSTIASETALAESQKRAADAEAHAVTLTSENRFLKRMVVWGLVVAILTAYLSIWPLVVALYDAFTD